MSKFSDKFVDGMSLVAEKVDENKFLGAIKDSFTIYMPFVIVGSFYEPVQHHPVQHHYRPCQVGSRTGSTEAYLYRCKLCNAVLHDPAHRVPDRSQAGQEEQCAGAHLRYYGAGFLSDHLPADRLCSGGRQDWHRQWPARCSIGFSGSVRGYAGRHSGKPAVRLPDDLR